MSTTSKYEVYKNTLKRIHDVHNAMAVLHWDQEVYMPTKGASPRGSQLATLSGIAHNMSVDKAFGELLAELKVDDSLSQEQAKNVAETYKDYQKKTNYTQSFVERRTMLITKAFHAWKEAKSKNDFSLYEKPLQDLVNLKLEEAEILGYEDHPYNALLNEYEPKATVAFLDPLFDGVREKCSALLAKVQASQAPKIPFAGRKFDKDAQWEVGLRLLEQMQYDFDAGRQDISTHPFTTSFSPLDVRVTTRINEEDVLEMIGSCIHEGGHALYEQGLLPENYGLPAGSAISLGVHESQSRLWENNVGRSLAYWKCNFPMMLEHFPEVLQDAKAEDIFNAANFVQPSLIRVQADELTYHFHILIRYEVEKALLSKAVEVKDLPALWNSLYKKYLNVEVPNDGEGVLQDIHWAHGSFGYFPTYSLGSFYAAQYFKQAEKEIDNLNELIAQGNLLPLKLWLNENIHQYGKLYSADELCRKVTGNSLDVDVFMEYMEEKLGRVYGF